MTRGSDPAIAALLREGGFSALAQEARDRLAELATLEAIPAGEWLFRAGEMTDACYVVETGSFEVVTEATEHDQEGGVLRVLSRGATLGELGVLAGTPRSASVRARRDATVVRIDAARFAELLDHPAFAAAQIKSLAAELQASRAIEPGALDTARLVTVVPAAANLSSGEVVARLAELIGASARCTVIGPEAEEDQVAEDAFEIRRRLATRVAEAERSADIVLLDAEPADGDPESGEAWTAACARQGDRVVVVADSDAEPPQLPVADGVLVDVVFCGPRPPLPLLQRWLDALSPRAHWFVSDPPRFDGLEREARALLGRSTALVLSGGGARAFAAIGVVMELRAAGIAIDRFGGTSGGAYVGGLAARGMEPEAMRDLVREQFVERNPLGDLTVPVVAVTRGQNARAMVRASFGDLQAEELETRLFAVSVDLLTGDEVVLDRGPLYMIIGASMSVPGMLPPLPYRDWLLLDGGVVNNFPVDEMLAVADGPVIAVDVSAGYRPRETRTRSARPGLEPAGRGLRRLVTGHEQVLPGIREVLGASMDMRGVIASAVQPLAADLLIRPPVTDMGIFEWERLDDVIESGREAARAALEANPELVAGLASS